MPRPPKQVAEVGDEATTPGRVRIWDLPTRLTHGLLILLIPFSWWSAVNDHLSWHFLSGFTILGLLVFRLIWGVIGSQTARFNRLLTGPRTLAAYARGRLPPRVGHNPLGGWSVIALLSVLALQVGLGLFAIDEDGFLGGPLTKFVSFNTGRVIAHFHHEVFWILVALIALHLAAVVVYAVRRKNLVLPMITGRERLAPGLSPPAMASPLRMAVSIAIAAIVAWFVAHGLSFKP